MTKKEPVKQMQAPPEKRVLSEASKAQKKVSTLNNAAEKIMFGARSRY